VSDFLMSWGPTIAIMAVVLVIIRGAVAKQTKLISSSNDNRVQQTAELKKIGQSLERIAVALEKQEDGHC
jgi:hypothetical protein